MVIFGTVSYSPYVQFSDVCPSDCSTVCLPKDFSFPLFEDGVLDYFNDPVHLVRCGSNEDLFASVADGSIDYAFPINSASLPPKAIFNITNGKLPALRWVELFSTPIIIMFDPTRIIMSPWFISLKQILMLSPFFLLILAGCFLSGVFMWLLERKENQRDFGDPKPFRGILSATWFIAVTVTTVGYGEQAPRTWTGRIVALMWMCGYYVMFTTIATTATNLLSNRREFGARDLFSTALSQDENVGTLRNSFAHAYTHMISSEISEETAANANKRPITVFDSVSELCQAMVDKKVIAAFGSAPALKNCDSRYLHDHWQLLQGDVIDATETYELFYRAGDDQFVNEVLAPHLQKVSRSKLYFDISINAALNSVAWQQYYDNLQSFAVSVCYITTIVIITASIKLMWYCCYITPKRKRTLTMATERLWDTLDTSEVEMKEAPPPSPLSPASASASASDSPLTSPLVRKSKKPIGHKRQRTHSTVLSEQYSSLAKSHSNEMRRLEEAYRSKREKLKRKHYSRLQDSVPYLGT